MSENRKSSSSLVYHEASKVSPDRGKEVAQHATNYLRKNSTKWIGTMQGWIDYGDRDACYLLYDHWPQIKREA